MKPLLLIVEDDTDDIEFYQMAFSRIAEKAEVRYFSDGETLLCYLEEKKEQALPAFCIISDINLPGLNGISLLSLLKQDAKFQNVPVTIVTTSSSSMQKKMCMDNGARSFYTKPNNLIDWVIILQAIVESLICPDSRS